MAIAKEDIKPGWYWPLDQRQARYVAHVIELTTYFDPPDTSLMVEFHGLDDLEALDDVLRTDKFVARIEPPEGV
jgi:hypothetical protein